MKRNFGGTIGYVKYISLLLCLISFNMFNPVFAQNTGVNPEDTNSRQDSAENTLRTITLIKKGIEDSAAYDSSTAYNVTAHYAGTTWNMLEQLVPLKSDWNKYDWNAEGNGRMPGDNLAAQDWARSMLGMSSMDVTWANAMVFVKPLYLAGFFLFIIELRRASLRNSRRKINKKDALKKEQISKAADLDYNLNKIIDALNSTIGAFKRETKISWSVILPAVLKVSIKVNILDRGLAATRLFYDEIIDDLTGRQGAIAKGLMGLTTPPSPPEELAKTNIMLWKMVNEMLASGFLAAQVAQALSGFALTNAEGKVDEIYAIALLRSAHQELQNENY